MISGSYNILSLLMGHIRNDMVNVGLWVPEGAALFTVYSHSPLQLSGSQIQSARLSAHMPLTFISIFGAADLATC